VLVRSRLIVHGNAAATASGIPASPGLFRAGFLADSLMVLCDVGLAVLLYVLLKPAGRTLALAALFFRLTQTAVIAMNLLNFHAALLLLKGSGYESAPGPEGQQALASGSALCACGC